MEIVIPIIAAVVGVAAGAGGIFAYNKRNENGGKNKADDLVRKAKHEASEIVLNAKKEASRLTEKNQTEENERRKEWRATEKRLTERETTLDAKLDQLEKKTEKLAKEERELEELKNEVREIRTKQHEKLEKIAGLTRADARDKLMKMTENDIKQDLAGLVMKEQKEIRSSPWVNKKSFDFSPQCFLNSSSERSWKRYLPARQSDSPIFASQYFCFWASSWK